MKLGEGTYGLVKRENGKAVKYIHKSRHHLREYVMMMVLKDCENIVSCSDVDFDEKSISMDLYDSNLKTYLFNNNNTNSKQTDYIIIEIAKGLHQMHSKKISHADLKLDNILIKVDNNKITKLVLGDCGLSCDHKYARIQYTGESYRDKILIRDGKHDIFSFGVCIYEIITGERAKNPDQSAMMRKSQAISNSFYKILLIKIFGPRNLRPTTSEILKYLNCEYTVQEIPKLFDKPVEIKKLINYGSFKNITIKEIFMKLFEKYNIVRCNKGYNILTHMLIKYNIDSKYYNDWISVMIYILYNMYPHKITFDDIDSFKISEYKNIINKIIKDEHFIYIMI